MICCSPSEHSSQDEQIHSSIVKQPNPMLLPLSSSSFSFIGSSNPFFRQPLSLSRNMLEASNAVREIRKSVMGNVDRFMKMLEKIASQNEVFEKIASFSSHLQTGLQIPRRNFLLNSIIHSNSNFAAILPGDSVAGIVVTNGILNFLNIYNTVLVVRLVLTWFPNAPPAIVSPLSTLCDPYLNIFRGIIPPLGGTLDLSPILAFLVLNAFTSAASALPAELPQVEEKVLKGVSSPTMASDHLTTTSSRQKWLRRISGKK